VLLDLDAFADLLRNVNNRETLMQNDRRVKGEIEATATLAALDPAQASRLYRAALTRLTQMRWRDEALDQEVEAQLARAESDAAALEDRIRSTLAVLGAARV